MANHDAARKAAYMERTNRRRLYTQPEAESGQVDDDDGEDHDKFDLGDM